MAITSANQLELLQTAEAVAREKQIDPSLVVEAMEESLARAAKSRYGAEMDIRVKIDRRTGRASFTRVRTVTEADDIETMQAESTADQAATIVKQARTGVTVVKGSRKITSPETGESRTEANRRFLMRAPTEADRALMVEDQSTMPTLGDEIVDEVPPVELGRIAAQSAKQVILQKVREAERDKQFEEFKDRIGHIINVVVKREEYGNLIVELNPGEGVLRRNEKIGREAYRPGDRIRVYIKDVRREPRGPQIFLSRTAPEFMAELFKMEVPEIYEGIIEIKAVARDPGSRAKIAVISYDNSIDPVGACVGMRGSRVQAVVNELQGEKIDIIPWNEDMPTFLVNALQPAEVSKVVFDEDSERIEVVVPEEQLSLAIGRRGQNVRLASQLTGLDIDILTEEEESKRRQAEFEERTKLFMDTLDLDEFFAQLLVAEGFTNLEEVAYVDQDELLVIDGVDEGTATELQARARDYIDAQNKAALDKAREMGAEDSLITFPGLTPPMVLALAADGVKTLEDFATCADWELAGGWTTDAAGNRTKDEGLLESFDISLEEAQDLVMTARVALGWVDPDELAAQEAAAAAEAEEEAAAG
ncbi:transcription termination factor NusA [Wenxinia marina]|uniref:Transcription termination/antitermination protein NusA n=1 Tax=Wenxinia marina DSM 24838 TaxID=1123501 RepID=A0A0D0Q9B2_9RHOB|nr:transcription termination factor NusA [Wenxinia marina]KIQ71014.1 NusA antitermination factor [Wenxinia marina DSM 24838]GGL55550.1 transcription termination/antitermination protein NusA [Wenxinia marina]